MTVLNLHWLGPPGIECDDRPVRLEMRKSLALLAYLSLNSQSPTRETLASLFWPEFDQQHALANLRRHLSSLAKCLPAGILSADREKITLNRDDTLAVDVFQFREQLSTAENVPRASDGHEEVIAALESAVALYRGDFFEGFNLKDCPEFDDWQYFQREGLRFAYGNALEKLAMACREAGDWDKAVGYARSWLAMDRLHEPAHRLLMSVLFLSGDKRAALRQFEDCRQILEQELGQPPEAETLERYEEIRQGAVPEGLDAISLQKVSAAEPCALLTRTKFFLPKVPRTILHRPRLVSMLNRCVELPLTVISASAGFGKTTLLAEWAAQSPDIIAWVSLDRSDNDVYRLLDYIVQAIRNVFPGMRVGAVALGMLHSPQPVELTLILGSLINDLLALPQHLVLVLDDYQNIDARNTHDAINFLLDHQPDNLHLIISTRTDPPLSLSRLRANLQLGDIRTDDLRFNSEETRQLITQAIGFPLSSQDEVYFENKVEGWIAGIQMAALVMQSPNQSQSSSRVHSFIQAFKSSQRHILDYLIEEVLNRQTEEIRSFLIHTSILDKLCFQLCDSLLTEEEEEKLGPPRDLHAAARISSQQILESLEKSNLFLIPLDDERNWYRYHHLFADLLHVRLQQYEPGMEAVLHRRAASWYARNGFPLEAVKHALDSSDFAYAADLIEEFSLKLIWMNQIVTTLDWFKSLPPEAIESHPLLNIYQTFMLARRGEFERVEAILFKAEASIVSMAPSPKVDEYKILLSGMRAFIANLQGIPENAIKYTQGIAPIPGGRPTASYYMVRVQLAIACLDMGDIPSAERIFAEIVQWAQRNQDVFYAVLTNKELAEIACIKGSLSQAAQLHRQMNDWIHRTVEEPALYDGLIKVYQANLLIEKNELDSACLILQEDIESLLSAWRSSSLYIGTMVLGYLYTALKDFPRAKFAVERSVQLVNAQSLYPRFKSMVQACQVNLWLAEGNLAEAQQWARMNFPQIPDQVPVVRELDALCLARVLVAGQRWEEALDLLQKLAASAESGKRFGRLLKIDILRALALQGLSRSVEALSLLDGCLSFSCPEGYMRVFLDEGAPMLSLLQSGMDAGRWQDAEIREYAARLLDAF